jgi:hypothetical protein
MSTNLVASAAKLLTPDLLSRVASMLGIDQSMIEKAAAAGIPGLLAAFTSLSSKPGGAAKLADAVAQQPAGGLSSLAGAGVSAQRSAVEGGLGTLSSLLGGSTISTMTQALSRYAGVSDTGAKGILGLLGPLVLGVLGQQQKATGLDASGLAQLLQSQKSSIMRAIPDGFANQLGGSNILDTVSSTASGYERRASEAVRDHSSSSWLLPVLGLIAVGALAWYLFARDHSDRTVATAPQSEMSTQAGQPIVVSETEVSQWIGRPVYSADNVKIGEIVEINRGPDNKVVDIIFDSGAAMGMGAVRHRALANQLREVKPDAITLTVKENEVATVPPPNP